MPLSAALRAIARPALLIGVGLVGTALAAVGPVAPAARPANSQCRAGEVVIYSCRFGTASRPAIGSVCGGTQSVHYRYGPAGRPALDIASAPDWRNVHVDGVRGQGGGFQDHVRFTSGETHYIVFRGEDGSLASRPGRTYSGIAVLAGPQGERALATLACRGGATIAADLTGAVIDRAPPGAELGEETDGPFDAWF